VAQVVALIDDIFFQAKIGETAKQLGLEFRACSTSDALQSEIAKDAPKLVVIDLNSRGNPLDAISRLTADAQDIPLIGFLSHVQVDLAQKARAAGCREVMPRSKFTENMATILSQAKSDS
jgi:DNA-binding NarL/FixJ family response regulator